MPKPLPVSASVRRCRRRIHTEPQDLLLTRRERAVSGVDLLASGSGSRPSPRPSAGRRRIPWSSRSNARWLEPSSSERMRSQSPAVSPRSLRGTENVELLRYLGDLRLAREPRRRRFRSARTKRFICWNICTVIAHRASLSAIARRIDWRIQIARSETPLRRARSGRRLGSARGFPSAIRSGDLSPRSGSRGDVPTIPGLAEDHARRRASSSPCRACG